MKSLYALICASVCSCCTMLAIAADSTYEVEYATKSPIKSMPLKNATLMLELYDYQKPHGFLEVKTDGNGTFTMKESKDFEVVSVLGEKQYNARCGGYATADHKKIQITCEPR